MKRLINSIFIIPLLFIGFGLIAFIVYYSYFLQNMTEKEFNKATYYVMQNKKKFLKIQLNSIIKATDEIMLTSYSLTEKTMKHLLEIMTRNLEKYHKHGNIKEFFKSHKTKNMFFYIISDKLVYPKIYQSFIMFGNQKHLLVHYNHKKYLAFEIKKDGKIFGIAIELNLIDKIVKKEIVNFISAIDKSNKSSYIAIIKIIKWYAKKGKFAKVIYHPNKKLIGKYISLDVKDVKGKYYRKKYLRCLAYNDGCYITYYYENPMTKKVEKKLSYFVIYRPYNWVFMKGIYFSQIYKDIAKIKANILYTIKELFVSTFILLGVFVLISFFISFIISRKIKNKILEEYNSLENNYENTKEELLHRVYTDQITLLPNRQKLLEDIKNYKSICLIDIDNFSNYNDIYGFDMGDEILKFVAQYLLKKYKYVYKTGSDEFAIGFESKINKEELMSLTSINLNYKNIKINLSAGASHLSGKLFETAETALKLAYKDQNIKYKIYDYNMQKEQKCKIEKIQHLSKVLEEKKVIPYYQCIVDKEGNIIKYESLMRIQIDDKIFSPFEFMDLIKEAKLYNRFSRLMIEKVFEDLHKLKHPVSINLSFTDISNSITTKMILDLLKKNENSNIVFEILETENIEEFDKVIEFIVKVKKYGVKIAIDDFGSGYSNLVNILYLKPDFLKIDASLIKNIDNKMYNEIIKFIVQFARQFDIKTTAEFVSDKEKFLKLKELEVDEYQGFYFCKPQPIEKVIC